MTTKWPKEVPVLEAKDISRRGQFECLHPRSDRGCLIDWLDRAFPPESMANYLAFKAIQKESPETQPIAKWIYKRSISKRKRK